MLTRAAAEAAKMVSEDNVRAGRVVDAATVKEALDLIRGAVAIVYPMGLPRWSGSRVALYRAEAPKFKLRPRRNAEKKPFCFDPPKLGKIYAWVINTAPIFKLSRYVATIAWVNAKFRIIETHLLANSKNIFAFSFS